MKRDLPLSALGAVLFYGLDTLHVRAGIWTATAAPGVPWWYLGVYFAGILAAARLLRGIDRRYRVTYTGDLWLDAGSFVGLLVAHLLLFRHEVLLAAISGAVLAARLLWFRRPGDVAVAVLIAGIDAVVEWSMASASLFAYAHASLGPLPLWLVPLWGGLALSIRGFFGAARARPQPAGAPA